MTPRATPAPIRIGCSGYDYRDWRGGFYPEELAHDQWFAHYAERFDTVEINNTFYALPDASKVDQWKRQAPPGFRYAVKLSRYGTHMKRLKDPREWIANFLDPVERLGAHLGPVLVQLPPSWDADPARLRAFLDAAPARRRWAVEVRDRRWFTDEVYLALADANAALVWHDMLENHPRERTADFVYARYHGPDAPRERYAGAYPHQRLTAEGRTFAELAADGTEVFAYFNNDVGAHAPRDAARLRRYAEQALAPP